MPVAEGGQGLVNVHAEVTAFSFQTAGRLLYDCGPTWLDTAKLLLRELGGWAITSNSSFYSLEVDLTGCPPIYCSFLQTWQVVKMTHPLEETPGMWLFSHYSFPSLHTSHRGLAAGRRKAALFYDHKPRQVPRKNGRRKREKGHPSASCQVAEQKIVVGSQGVEVEGGFWSRFFFDWQLEVPVQAAS